VVNYDITLKIILFDLEYTIYSLKKKNYTHFSKYPLRGTKYLDFLYFKEALDIIESKEHLTDEGLNKLSILSKSRPYDVQIILSGTQL
jgi:hypothetical protein